MIWVAIVEDEPPCQERLVTFLEQFSVEHNVPIQTEVFSDGLHFLEHYCPKYDVILMDIQMPGLDGLTIAKRLRELDQDVILIFITNMAQFALKGYEVQAYDFVVKPVVYPAFAQKLERVVRILNRRPSKYIMLPLDGTMRKLPTADILYIEMSHHRLYCHTVDGVCQMPFGTIAALEEQLATAAFARCNSGYLVNLRHVSAIARDSIVVGGDTLPVSRPRKKEFLKILNEFVGRG